MNNSIFSLRRSISHHRPKPSQSYSKPWPHQSPPTTTSAVSFISDTTKSAISRCTPSSTWGSDTTAPFRFYRFAPFIFLVKPITTWHHSPSTPAKSHCATQFLLLSRLTQPPLLFFPPSLFTLSPFLSRYNLNCKVSYKTSVWYPYRFTFKRIKFSNCNSIVKTYLGSLLGAH